MARKPTDIGNAGNERLLALTAQGWTAQAIAEDLNLAGHKVSRSWVDERMRRARGRVVSPKARAAPSFAADLASAAEPGSVSSDSRDVPEPAESDELPTADDIAEAAKGGPEAIDQMLASFVAQYQTTPPGPLKKSWGALVKDTLKEKRTGTPKPPSDPNQHPDMVALAAEARAGLLKAIALVQEVM